MIGIENGHVQVLILMYAIKDLVCQIPFKLVLMQ
jgi:hypothetical protein